MQFELASSDLSEVHGEENSQIRIFTVPIRSAGKPRKMLDGGRWHYGAVDSVKSRVSAVAYYFARRLQRELGVPVGILSAARGSTAAEEWMNPALFEHLDSTVRARYEPSPDRWAGCWYNAMIHPLAPYKVAGFVWYQGENNTSRPETYSAVMSRLISGWRADFGDESLPFYLVELAPFSQDWSRFRLIQQAIADRTPHCGFVSILDAGDLANIHPVDKFPVGDRLGQLALANCYGLDFRGQVPRFRRAKRERDALRLFFDHVGDGLVSACGNEGSLLEIAGEDGVFCPCTMKIEGKTLLLRSAEVSDPRYARYFFGKYATASLYASDGWPVAPFCMTPRVAKPDAAQKIDSTIRYLGKEMPRLSDPAWRPFGIDAAGTLLDLDREGLHVVMTAGAYGYQLPIERRKQRPRALHLVAAVKNGALDLVVNEGKRAWLSIKVTRDAVINALSGDTLAMGLDNSRMTDFRLEFAEDEPLRVFCNDAMVGECAVHGDSSWSEDFETGQLDRSGFSFSPWSKASLSEVRPLSGDCSLVWQNGTTGLLSRKSPLKPNCSYRLSFKTALSEGGGRTQVMQGMIKCADRVVAPVRISGSQPVEYVYTFQTGPEEHMLNVTLHNGYNATRAAELVLDDWRLEELTGTPCVQFGNLQGGPADWRIRMLELE